MQNKKELVLVKKQNETTDVVSLYFKLVDGGIFDFIPGQFINVKPVAANGHGKFYTISGIPSDDSLCLTIKKKNNISLQMIDMKIGEKIFVDGPYGIFYPDNDMQDIVMIAGGVGITPFYSYIKNECEKDDKQKKIRLLYSCKTTDDIIFLNDINKLSSYNPNFKVNYYLTQDNNNNTIGEKKRIDKNVLLERVAPAIDRNYYICGSISFVDDIWRNLKEIGVLEECIYTEAFY